MNLTILLFKAPITATSSSHEPHAHATTTNLLGRYLSLYVANLLVVMS